MKKIVRILSLVLCVSFVFALCGCGEFKINNVDSISLVCPDPENPEGKSVMLSANMSSSDFYEIIEICQGEELEELEEKPFFGMAKIVFTQLDGNTVTIYPACDGSPYLCLNSLNENLASYIKLTDGAMARLTAILKKHEIVLS